MLAADGTPTGAVCPIALVCPPCLAFKTFGDHQFGIEGEEPGTFNMPTYIALAPDGGILVRPLPSPDSQRISA